MMRDPEEGPPTSWGALSQGLLRLASEDKSWFPVEPQMA